MGPGEKMVLITSDCRAIFGWRKFIDASGQEGVNCAFFRNEGAFDRSILSSTLIKKAEVLAWQRWGGEARLYTYVSPHTSDNPGFCFKQAGWKLVRGESGRPKMTKSGLFILEKYPDRHGIAK
jgi:hypothetical protein